MDALALKVVSEAYLIAKRKARCMELGLEVRPNGSRYTDSDIAYYNGEALGLAVAIGAIRDDEHRNTLMDLQNQIRKEFGDA